MINTITMSDVATYTDEPQSLKDCQRVNFIFGSNGSGKTTISNFLMDEKNPKYNKCKIEESGLPCEKIVYNKEFREKNFKNTDIAGIFTLGKDTIAALEVLRQLQEKRDEQKKQFLRSESTKTEFENNNKELLETLKNDLWNNIYKKYQTKYDQAFKGFKTKEKFLSKSLEVYAKGKQTLVESEIEQRANKILTSKPEKVSFLNLDWQWHMKYTFLIEKDDLWNKIIVGKTDVPIAKMISKLQNQDWVNQGRRLIPITNGICPFCQKKTIDDDLVQQLNNFFDGEYENQVNEMIEKRETYKNHVNSIIDNLKDVLRMEDIINIATLNIVDYENNVDLLNNSFKKNITLMDDKIKEPGKKVELEDTSHILKDILIKLEKVVIEINDFNEMVTNYNSERDKLINEIWSLCVFKEERSISEYIKKKRNNDKAIQGISSKLKGLSEEIKTSENSIHEKESTITSCQPTIDSINHSLKAYGFESFKIAPSPDKENCYQIQRMDGSLVSNTLSEGEETFISFLYFMQLAFGSQDKEKVSNKKILVIDDPICSLDSNILYIVSAMIKDLIRNSINHGIEQFYILTHNVFFHKEVAFRDGKNEERKDTRFWIIKKVNNKSEILPYGRSNPIKTTYELLWKDIKNPNSSSMISVQNTMRRIIENYFSLLGSKERLDDVLINSFETIEEKTICKSLLYWINDGSHSIQDDLYIDNYNDSVDKYIEVFRNIFIKTGNEAHYKMMMLVE